MSLFRFLKNLGMDIGHNVITPNMHFKYLFRQLEKKIAAIDIEMRSASEMPLKNQLAVIDRCTEIRHDLEKCHRKLLKHYNRTSLFLESLLREEHFAKGHLVLKARECLVEREIVLPELEIYGNRFAQRGIAVEQPKNMENLILPVPDLATDDHYA